MNKIILPEKPVIGAQAWRITFDNVEKDQPAGTVIREPRYAAADAHPVAVDTALAASGDADDTSMLIIWLPTRDAVPADLERNVELWVGRSSHDRPAIRASIRTVRVVWADARALVYAAPDQWADTLDAILRFTLMAREISDLEQQMQSVWAGVAVSSRQKGPLRQIVKMTEAVTRMKTSYLLMQSAIKQIDQRLSNASKRLCAELILQAAIFDRLEVLNEPIQFALDHYELANTRRIERKNVSIELCLMGLIVIGLFIQTAVMLVQELGPVWRKLTG